MACSVKIKFKNIDYYSNLSEEETVKYIKNVVFALTQTDFNKKNSLFFEYIQRITIAYYDLNKHAVAVSKVLIKEDYVKAVTPYIETNIENDTDKTMDAILNNFINYSAINENFGKSLFRNPIFKVLLNKLKKTKVSDFSTISKYLNIIHNVTRDLENQLNKDILDTLILIINNELQNECYGLKNKTLASLVLAYTTCGDKDTLKKYEEDVKSTVEDLIKMIGKVNEVDFRNQGFSILSMLFGLRCLCSTDFLRKHFFDNEGLEMIGNLLIKHKDRFDEDCTINILHILLHLLLFEGIKDKVVLFDFNLLFKMSENFKNNEIISLRSHIAEEIGKDNMNISIAGGKFKFDIFISYCHKNQERILTITDQIRKQNLKIWIDRDNMNYGNIFSQMSQGINDSHMVLLGITKDYVSSANCQREANFSGSREKLLIPVYLDDYRAQEWLAILVEGVKYYVYSDRKNTSAELIRDVVGHFKEIKYPGIPMSIESKSSTTTTTTTKVTASKPRSTKESPKESSTNIDKIKDKLKVWTFKEINEFFHEGNVTNSELIPKNRHILLTMLKGYLKSPEDFKKSYKEEYKLKEMEANELITLMDILLEIE